MAGTSTSITISTSAEHLFNILKDVSAYPEFIPEMKKISILSEDDQKARIEHHTKIMGFSVDYTLDYQFDPPYRLSWSFVKGNRMKNNVGSWQLVPKGEHEVEATYNISVEVGALVPKKIVDQLMKVQLPTLMNQFKKRAESLYEKGV